MRLRGKLHRGTAGFAILVALALIAGCAPKATSPSSTLATAPPTTTATPMPTTTTATPTPAQAAGYPNADLVVETRSGAPLGKFSGAVTIVVQGAQSTRLTIPISGVSMMK